MRTSRKHLIQTGAAVVAGLIAILLLTPLGRASWNGMTHIAGASHHGVASKSGPRGRRGPRGPRGRRGPRGYRGANGPTGARGAQGLQGVQGIQGVAGARGPAGGRAVYCAAVAAHPSSFPSTACDAGVNVIPDPAATVGYFNSLAIGAGGNPVLAYYDITNSDLKLARCLDATCTGAVLTTPDSAGDVGQFTSLVIGTDGNPVVSYYVGGAATGSVAILHCTDPACTTSVRRVLTPTVDQTATSIAIGTNGNPVVSLHYTGSGGLMDIAVCNDQACASPPTYRTLDDPPEDVGRDSSLAIGTDGNPVVSYYDATKGDLKIAHCIDSTCALAAHVHVLDSSSDDVGQFTSLAIGADRNPVVSYYDNTNGVVKVAHCADPDCAATPAIHTVDDPNDASGRFSSIAIGVDGNPVVGYNNLTDGIYKIAECADPACAKPPRIHPVGAISMGSGWATSLKIGADGAPIASFAYIPSGQLRVGWPPFSARN